MKKRDFKELRRSLAQALAHARGKITLKTKDVLVPAKVERIQPRYRQNST